LNGTNTHRYVGTIRGFNINKLTDNETKRFVWNYYNREERTFFKPDGTASWTYSTAAWRQVRGDTYNVVEAVIGTAGSQIFLKHNGMAQGDYNYVSNYIGMSEDSTSVNDPKATINDLVTGIGLFSNGMAFLIKYPSIGYHYWAMLEYGGGSGTTTWLGSGFGGASLSGSITG